MATIILVSDHFKDASFASKVAQECGAKVKLLSDIYNAVNEALVTPDLIAFFIDTQPRERLTIFEDKIAGRIKKDIVHGITETKDLSDLDIYLQSPVIGNFIIRRYGDIAQDASHYARVVRLSGQVQPFGLTALLRPETEIQTLQLTETHQKGFAASSVVSHLQELGCSERVALSVSGAVDELLMNAMFDAPVDADGKQVMERTPRDYDIVLPGVEMQLGCEGEFIGVSVIDRVGSLNRSAVLRYAAKSYGTQQSVRGKEYSGAGLGLSLVLRSGGSLLFVTNPGKRTDVTVFFRRTSTVKELKSQFQFVSSKICGS